MFQDQLVLAIWGCFHEHHPNGRATISRLFELMHARGLLPVASLDDLSVLLCGGFQNGEVGEPIPQPVPGSVLEELMQDFQSYKTTRMRGDGTVSSQGKAPHGA